MDGKTICFVTTSNTLNIALMSSFYSISKACLNARMRAGVRRHLKMKSCR